MGRGPAKIARLETYPLDMTDGQLRAALGGLPDSELMRSLIMAEVAAIRGGAERETRTMRGLWYDFVKPVLSRAGRLGDKTKGGKDVDWPGEAFNLPDRTGTRGRNILRGAAHY